MAPFDFNYVQDDLLSIAADRSAIPVRVSFQSTDLLAPVRPTPVSQPPAQPLLRTMMRDDTMLRAVAADRAATIRYDTEIVTNSFTEILLELLDRNATLTSLGFIICYVGLLRSL